MILRAAFLSEALPSSLLALGAKTLPTTSVEHLGALEGQEVTVCIDSRKIVPSSLFVALIGERNDGHDFLENVLKGGAKALLVNRSKQNALLALDEDLVKGVLLIWVEDTVAALYALAKAWRDQFDIPLVGITGSVGKTTTKEMLRTIFKKASIGAYVSHRNQNSHIGLPLNILALRPEHEVGVFEMGINDIGEMDHLAALLRPTIGVVTCLAHAHVGFLGNQKAVLREKRKIFSCFVPGNIGVVCGDQPLLAQASYPHPVVKFGTKMKNQVQARKLKVVPPLELTSQKDTFELPYLSFLLDVYGQRQQVRLHNCSKGSVNNALAAASVAHLLGVSFEHIVAGLVAYRGFEGRFEPLKLKNGKGWLIDDAYNASPESIKSALETFDRVRASGPKIAVLGDMLELGDQEVYWHRQIGRNLGKMPSIDHVIFVGARAAAAEKTAPISMKVTCVNTWEEAQKMLLDLLENEAVVLLKASNSVGLSNVAKNLT